MDNTVLPYKIKGALYDRLACRGESARDLSDVIAAVLALVIAEAYLSALGGFFVLMQSIMACNNYILMLFFKLIFYLGFSCSLQQVCTSKSCEPSSLVACIPHKDRFAL